jgi:hypothetical protein
MPPLLGASVELDLLLFNARLRGGRRHERGIGHGAAARGFSGQGNQCLVNWSNLPQLTESFLSEVAPVNLYSETAPGVTVPVSHRQCLLVSKLRVTLPRR